MKAVTELDFEAAIEAWLVDHAGYEKAENGQFDAALALDTDTLLAFIKQTQPDTWDKLSANYGGTVEKSVVARIALECDSRGLLDVVRNGVRDRGQTIHLAYFKPATGLNPETEKRYQQNRNYRSHALRQVAVSAERLKIVFPRGAWEQ